MDGDFTVRMPTEDEYEMGCTALGGVCQPREGQTAPLVVVGRDVLCTAHATWDVGARIAAMGLRAGLRKR